MSDHAVQGIGDCSDDHDRRAGENGAWASLLNNLCQLQHATTALLATIDRSCRVVRVHCSVNVLDRHLHAYTARYAAFDPFIKILGSVAAGTVWAVTNSADENMGIFFRDWLEPQGIFHVIYGVIASRSSHTTYVWVGRHHNAGSYRDEDVELLRSVLPWVQTAFRADRLIEHLQQTHKTLVALMDELSMGIVLLDGYFEPRFINRSAKAAFAGEGRLKALLPLICEPARQASRNRDLRIPSGIDPAIEPSWMRTIERLPNQRPLTVLVQRLPTGRIHGSHDEPSFILLIGDPDGLAAVDQETLQRLHGLTPAESHVVALLVCGKHLKEAARALGISVQTARTHLKRIFSKTETSSQADLVRLVLSVPSPIHRGIVRRVAIAAAIPAVSSCLRARPQQRSARAPRI